MARDEMQKHSMNASVERTLRSSHFLEGQVVIGQTLVSP